jgi:arylsulfatase
VRWFSPEEYGNPSTIDDLNDHADVALYDLANDPGELENLGHPDHPRHDRALVQRMLDKLHVLVQQEIGDDHAPFDLNLFGTREIKYGRGDAGQAQRASAVAIAGAQLE